MSEQMGSRMEGPVHTFEQGKEVLDKMLDVARTETVYSQPVTQGGYTIIQTSEAVGAVGFGFGMGGQTGEEEHAVEVRGAGEGMGNMPVAEGGGGGGGGYSYARPVAVIELGPEGVRMQPIVDVTKIGIALLTTVGSMMLMMGRMRRMR